MTFESDLAQNSQYDSNLCTKPQAENIHHLWYLLIRFHLKLKSSVLKCIFPLLSALPVEKIYQRSGWHNKRFSSHTCGLVPRHVHTLLTHTVHTDLAALTAHQTHKWKHTHKSIYLFCHSKTMEQGLILLHLLFQMTDPTDCSHSQSLQHWNSSRLTNDLVSSELNCSMTQANFNLQYGHLHTPI